MDERLERKVTALESLAEGLGWQTERNYADFDGSPGVQLVGVRYDGLPDASHIEFGFSVAFAINPRTNRVTAMRLDGKANAVFVMVVEDGTGRYWYGPLSAAERALDDPAGWTGIELPPEEEVTIPSLSYPVYSCGHASRMCRFVGGVYFGIDS